MVYLTPPARISFPKIDVDKRQALKYRYCNNTVKKNTHFFANEKCIV